MKTGTKLISLLMMASMLLVSCGSIARKVKAMATNETSETTADDAQKKDHKVYILYSTGNEDNPEEPGEYVIWKNGETKTVPSYSDDSFSFGATIMTVDDDIVTLGGDMSLTDGGGDVSQIAQWHNGDFKKLGPGKSYEGAMDIIHDDGNTYLLGHVNLDGNPQNVEIWVWKNGNLESKIVKTGDDYVCGRCILVENGATYIAGAFVNNGMMKPVMWKNGTASLLEQISGKTGIAEGMVEKDDHIYTVGCFNKDYDEGTYDLVVWQDGKIFKKLLTESADIEEVKIRKDDGNIYVAATINNDGKQTTKVWKNYKQQEIGNSQDGFHMNEIDVKDGIIYMVGYDNDRKPVYLVNGKKVGIDGLKPNTTLHSIRVED